MVHDFPDVILALIVPHLVDYRDFRQLLWLCRAGGNILAQVLSLDVNGVYTSGGSSGNPFNYVHFHALLRLTVTLRFCMFPVYYAFVQFAGVRELNLRLFSVNYGEFASLMWWLEFDLNDKVRHVGIHVAQQFFLDRQHSREWLAEHVLKLSKHSTLDTFSVSIAGVSCTILWACKQLGMDLPA